MVLPILSNLERIEGALTEAAATLGASPFHVWKEVLLPLLVPGIAGGTNIVFALAMSAYVTPAVLGPERAEFHHHAHLPAFRYAVRLADRLGPRSGPVHHVDDGDRPLQRLPRAIWPQNDWSAMMAIVHRLFVLLAACFLAAPTFVVLVTSFGRNATLEFPPSPWSLVWYGRALSRTEFQSAAFNSFWIAVITTLMATPIALAAALAIVRGKFPGRRRSRSFCSRLSSCRAS